MNLNPRLVAATVLVVVACWSVTKANAFTDPVSRAEVKAETREAAKAGKLTPAGEGPVVRIPRTTEKTRAQRKAETLAARREGTLKATGAAPDDKADRDLRAQQTTVNRAARKAQTRAEERAGTLVPAGEGPGSPRK